MRIHDAIIVGCGGTGSYLAEPLTRLLTFHPNASGRVTFIDGDVYEEGNATRQVFRECDLGRNKAEVTAERIRDFVPGSECDYHGGYLDPVGAQGAIVNHSVRQGEAGDDAFLLVVSAVDNHATRKAMIEAVDTIGLRTLFLSPGNALASGQVVAYVHPGTQSDGEVHSHPFVRHPELADPQDVMPGTCAQQAPATPQLIGANMGAALVTLWTVQGWLDGRGLYDCTSFDSVTLAVKGLGNPLSLDGEPMRALPTPEAVA